MHERGEPAIHAAWQLGGALKQMAKAARAQDDDALEAAIARACDAIREVSREGDDDDGE
jgi:hypothetical protein